MPQGKQAKRRYQKQQKNARRMRAGRPVYDSDDSMWSDDEGLNEAMGFDKKSMQQKYGISEELWNFMQANVDVENALGAVSKYKYDVKVVVNNWDRELMKNIMGSEEKADSVLRKLKYWLDTHGDKVGTIGNHISYNPYLLY